MIYEKTPASNLIAMTNAVLDLPNARGYEWNPTNEMSVTKGADDEANTNSLPMTVGYPFLSTVILYPMFCVVLACLREVVITACGRRFLLYVPCCHTERRVDVTR